MKTAEVKSTSESTKIVNSESNIQDQTLHELDVKKSQKRDCECMLQSPKPHPKEAKVKQVSPSKVINEINANKNAYSDLTGYLDFLKRTECYAKIKPAMDNQLYITEDMRAILVDWMSELCANYSLHRVTFHLSVNILDRYIATNSCIKRTEFQTVGAACVIIATKLYEPVSVNFDMMVQATGHSCTKEELKSFEYSIIKNLQWHFLTGTMADWTLFYLRQLETKDQVIPYDLYFRCMDLCDRLLLDYHYIHYLPREIALAVVSAFYFEYKELKETPLKNLLNKFNLVQDCVKWVLDIGLTTPSHAYLRLLQSDDGQSLRKEIETCKDMNMEFNYVQQYNQASLTNYSSLKAN